MMRSRTSLVDSPCSSELWSVQKDLRNGHEIPNVDVDVLEPDTSKTYV